MFEYEDEDSVLGLISSVYSLGLATIFLVIALYCTHCLKSDERAMEQQAQRNRRRQSNAVEYFPNKKGEKKKLGADGILGRLKTARAKRLEAQLTNDQLAEEKRIEREQMAEIFQLLKKQEADLNMQEIDECELTAQLGLYR